MPNESDKEEIGGDTAGAMAVVAGVAVLAAWCLSKWLGGNSDPEPNKRQEEKMMLSSSSSSRDVKWTKPSPGWFKLNTDAMWSHELKDAAAGGVIRDDEGRWIVGFTARLDCFDVTSAELQALSHGLCLTHSRGIHRVEIETDSQAAYYFIGKSNLNMDTHKYGKEVQKCRRLMTQYDLKFTFRKVYREENACADAMATRGRNQRELLKVWEKPPDEYVRQLVSEEMMNS